MSVKSQVSTGASGRASRGCDLRRSATRNLIRAGVPEKVARDFIGHRTSSMFDRYNITGEAELAAAAEELTAYPRGRRRNGRGRPVVGEART